MGNPLPSGIPESFWEQYRKRTEADITREREALAPLESGKMHIGRRRPGEQWTDITQEMIAQRKHAISVYEAILAALKRKELL
jgi:hypothetical protein